MIIDRIENLPRYFSVNDNFEAIYAFLTDYLKNPKPEGRYEIDGERLFVSISSYSTVPQDGKLPEAHRKYADVQVMLKGKELIGWAPIVGMKQVSGDFVNGDCGFFEGGELSYVLLTESTFALFLPDDAHMPCIMAGESEEVTKAVFKVQL